MDNFGEEIKKDILKSVDSNKVGLECDIKDAKDVETVKKPKDLNNWTEKDITFLKSIGVENIHLKDDGDIDITQLEKNHQMAMARRMRRRIFCDVCEKSFKNNSSLYSHKNKYHRSDQKIFKKRRTIAHSEIIENQKENNSNLDQNKQTDLENANDKRVPRRMRKAVDYDKMAKGTYKRLHCDICKKLFTNLKTLYSHKNQEHKEILGQEIVETIVIELCNNVVKEEISIKDEIPCDSEISTSENSIKQESSDNSRINDLLDIPEFELLNNHTIRYIIGTDNVHEYENAIIENDESNNCDISPSMPSTSTQSKV